MPNKSLQTENVIPLQHTRRSRSAPDGAVGESASCATSSVACMHSRPMAGENSCHRLPFTVSHPPTALSLCCEYGCWGRGDRHAEGRSTRYAKQRSNKNSYTFGSEQRLVPPLFCCPKERRETTSHFGLPSVKQVTANLQVQDANT